ncbi:MAG: hypothetical protein LBI03_06535 [Clostridiales bacterium]|jgi:hypothetical protein|nr:hypothetical protein [Clostridiales bacterium]
MLVNGCDCSIVIKTAHKEFDVPYSDETLHEAVSFLQEEASIEGDGVCGGLRKTCGVIGCIVTPLTIGTAHLLLCLAMGACGNPALVSETRNLYQYRLDLLPTEDTEHFDLIQDRGGERKFYEGCNVQGFELRILRDEAIKLKLEICGVCAPRIYPYVDTFEREQGERFKGDCVSYRINGKDFSNIYGITLVSKKIGGTHTELWIKRVLQQGGDIPAIIDELIITAKLLRNEYEYRYFGTFRITVKRLVQTNDETEINAADNVVGPLRYYVAGGVSAEVFTDGGGYIQ